MELSKEAAVCFNRALAMAAQNGYEFVTPEMLLLAITEDKTFCEAFEGCGGDIEMLRRNLMAYISGYVDRGEEGEASLSIGATFVLNFAAQSARSSGSDAVCIRHLIHAIWNVQDCYAPYYMERQDISEADVLKELSEIEDAELMEGDIGNTAEGKPGQDGLQA